jgi:hypothetical protein
MGASPLWARFFGGDALAAGLAADAVLAGEAAWVQETQLQELAFEVKDFFH